jgi:hypothetical protein
VSATHIALYSDPESSLIIPQNEKTPDKTRYTASVKSMLLTDTTMRRRRRRRK